MSDRLGTERVEEMLGMLYRRTGERDDEESLPLVAAVMAGQGTADERERAARVIAADAYYAEAMLALAALDEIEAKQPVMESGGVPGVEAEEKREENLGFLSRRTGTLLAAAAGVALIVTGGAMLLMPNDSRYRGGADLSIKAGADHLSIAVQRDRRKYTLRPGDTLEAGDRLGFFYTATSPGYLTIVHRDQRGVLTRVNDATPILAGEAVPMPDGAVMEPPHGCEWIVGVFSERPIAAGAIESALQSARVDVDRCELDVHVAGARRVQIYPVAR